MSYSAAIVFRDGNTRFIRVNENELLIDAALRQGVTLPVDCREGVCATCRCHCESGEVDLDYVDDEALTREELQAGHVLACQTRLRSAASFYFDVDAALCSVSPQRYQGVVSAVDLVSDSVVTLDVTLEGAEHLRFLPGQYARLQVPGSESWRAYSFANGEVVNGQIRFLIRLLPSGAMSDYLRQRAQPGDPIALDAPFGAFYLREVTRPLLMVAGGTGLSAFLSMLDRLEEQGARYPIRLCYGVTKEGDLCELARLEEYKLRLPDFDYQVIVMAPSAQWQGRQGVVCDLFDPGFLDAPFDAYLCGPPPMIEATQQWLASHPVAEHHLYFEKFVSS